MHLYQGKKGPTNLIIIELKGRMFFLLKKAGQRSTLVVSCNVHMFLRAIRKNWSVCNLSFFRHNIQLVSSKTINMHYTPQLFLYYCIWVHVERYSHPFHFSIRIAAIYNACNLKQTFETLNILKTPINNNKLR